MSCKTESHATRRAHIPVHYKLKQHDVSHLVALHVAWKRIQFQQLLHVDLVGVLVWVLPRGEFHWTCNKYCVEWIVCVPFSVQLCAGEQTRPALESIVTSNSRQTSQETVPFILPARETTSVTAVCRSETSSLRLPTQYSLPSRLAISNFELKWTLNTLENEWPPCCLFTQLLRSGFQEKCGSVVHNEIYRNFYYKPDLEKNMAAPYHRQASNMSFTVFPNTLNIKLISIRKYRTVDL